MARSGSISFRKIFGEEGRGLLAALFALPLVFYYAGGAVLHEIKEDAAEVRPDIIAEKSITEEAEFTINFLKDKVISEVLSCGSADILGEEEVIPRRIQQKDIFYLVYDPYQKGLVMRTASGDIHLQGSGMIEDIVFTAESGSLSFKIKAEHPMFRGDVIVSEGDAPVALKEGPPEGKALMLELYNKDVSEDPDI